MPPAPLSPVFTELGTCGCAQAAISQAQVELLDLVRLCRGGGEAFVSISYILLKNHQKFISVLSIVILG